MTSFTLQGEDLYLHPDRAIFWPRLSVLFIADLHLGKVNHFRKAGIAVPTKAAWQNFHLLQEVILTTNPNRVIILGDLFHSHHNRDWKRLGEFIDSFSEVRFELVMGNHDILSADHYKQNKMAIHEKSLHLGPFLLTHHPTENMEGYNLCGHVHPCIKIRGKGRQYLRMPCFYFGQTGGILPSFGSFTGMHAIEQKPEDIIYAIAGGQIIKIEQ